MKLFKLLAVSLWVISNNTVSVIYDSDCRDNMTVTNFTAGKGCALSVTNGFASQDSVIPVKDILPTMEAVEPYLEASGDTHMIPAVYVPPSQQLRNMAEELERKDAAIQSYRDLIKKLKEMQKGSK